MKLSTLDISWLATCCDFEGAEIYLGLASGMDDVVAHALKADQMVAFPFQTIRIASNEADEVPLRMYAVRQPSIVQVRPMPELAPVDGFRRVRLDFRIPLVTGSDIATPTAAAANVDGGPESLPSNSIMAFLLTIGLPVEREDEFYRAVVNESLQTSWMMMPSLLREIDSTALVQIAEIESHACGTA